MSAVDELLESEDVYSGPGSGANEEHIVIGRDRFITVPDSLKKIAVQYDRNVETLIFDCPRYWDDEDLSTYDIAINYTRADGAPGTYDATESISVDADDDSIIHFEWLVKKDVTIVAGTVEFAVCAEYPNGTDEPKRWNTEINKDAYISEGLDLNAIVEEKYPEFLALLDARMSDIERRYKDSGLTFDKLYSPEDCIYQDFDKGDTPVSDLPGGVHLIHLFIEFNRDNDVLIADLGSLFCVGDNGYTGGGPGTSLATESGDNIWVIPAYSNGTLTIEGVSGESYHAPYPGVLRGVKIAEF